jgi:hypothetical protein
MHALDRDGDNIGGLPEAGSEEGKGEKAAEEVHDGRSPVVRRVGVGQSTILIFHEAASTLRAEVAGSGYPC